MGKPKTESELGYYNLFFKLCTRHVRADLGNQFGHVPEWKRRMTAEDYCQRQWENHKEEFIPKLKQFKNKKVIDKNQREITEFIVESNSSLDDLTVEERTRLENEIDEMINEEIKKSKRINDKELDVLIDRELSGEFGSED